MSTASAVAEEQMAILFSGLCCIVPGSPRIYQQLPLQKVHVEARVYDLCAEVKIQQTFVNDLSMLPLECIYIFPLDEHSAVFSFEAKLDGIVVKGCIREKSDARSQYLAAIAAQRSAMLLEQSSDNIFECKVGNLNHGSVCTITLKYLTLLDQEGRHNRLTLPMTIAPKYTPQNPGLTPAFPCFPDAAPTNAVHMGCFCHACLCSPIIGARHHCDTCSADFCDGCHAKHAAENRHHLNETPGSMTLPSPKPMRSFAKAEMSNIFIMVDITMPSPILSIQCPSHTSEAKISKSNSPAYHGVVVFESASTSALSKDFIFLIEQQQCFEPRALCELDMKNGTAAISLAFVPPPIDMLSASQINCELIFLIDCSGSMHGPSVACVRDCMQILLRSLPVNSRFNIIKFGSTWSSLFPDSQQYNDESLSEASRHISMLEANLGGTEIYPPLYHVLSSKGKETHPRQVFLLTDGQVTNLNQLALLVSEHTATIRLFTFGIGNAVDRLLCKKLAEAGRGKCEFVAVEDKRGAVMREKVVRQIARALQPVLTDVTVDWGILKEPINQVEEDEVMVHSSMPPTVVAHNSFMQCPSVAPAIFMSTRYMLHALNVFLPDQVWQQAKEGKELDFECEIAFTARSNHPLEKEHVQYSVLLKASQITRAGVIHTLAVKERIRELEDKVLSCSVFEEKEKMEEEVLQLAMKYTLTSSKTSFVITYSDTASKGTEEVALSSDARRDSVAPAFHSFKRERPFRSGCKSKVGHEPLSSSRAVYRSSMSVMFNDERMCSSPMDTPLEEDACCFSSVPMSSSSIPVDLPGNLPQRDELSEAFTDLISLQSANGSWQLTPELINISVSIISRTGSFLPRALTIESVRAISNGYGIDDVSIAVILSLEILKKYFQQRQAEWEMLAAKAAFFLKNTCNMHANMQQKVQESVANLLGM